VTHGTFSKIDHILRHKASLNKYKKIKITPWILSDHNAKKKLELNKKSSSKNCTNNWQLNNTSLNDPWIMEETRGEIKNLLECKEKCKHNLSKPRGHSKNTPKKKVYSHECIY
jgi:hypothetical protein